ncbi:MAG: hypothetical protein ACK5IB_11060 [Qingshengfaniella sp.]
MVSTLVTILREAGAMKKLCTLAASAALIASASCAMAATQQIFFDDFNADTIETNAYSLTNWTVTHGSVDVFGPSNNNQYPGNGTYVHTAGTSSNPGRMTTREVLNLVPGLTYTLSLDLGKHYKNAHSRLAIHLADWSYTLTSAAGIAMPNFVPMSWDFTVTETSGQISMEASFGLDRGFIIDNVGLSVQMPDPIPDPSPVPVPAAGVLLLGGLSLMRLLKTAAGRQARTKSQAALAVATVR